MLQVGFSLFKKKFIVIFIAGSQIWPNFPMDDRHFDYIANLTKRTLIRTGTENRRETIGEHDVPRKFPYCSPSLFCFSHIIRRGGKRTGDAREPASERERERERERGWRWRWNLVSRKQNTSRSVVLKFGATMPRGRGEKTAGGVASSPESRCAFFFLVFLVCFLGRHCCVCDFFHQCWV